MRDLPTLFELAILTLAAWRLTRLAILDDFPPVQWVKQRLLARWPAPDTTYPDTGQVVPDGEFPSDGVIVQGRKWVRQVAVTWDDEVGEWLAVDPHWVGRLITCPWCLGFWVTAGVVAGWVLVPWSMWLWLVLAMAALVGIVAQLVDG